MDRCSLQHSDAAAGAPHRSRAGPSGLQLGRGLSMEFRTSRVKVEALDAMRGELWQTSGSTMDHKSLLDKEVRQTSALGTASHSQDVVAVKSEEWQGTLPQPVAMRTVGTVHCMPAGGAQLNGSSIVPFAVSAAMPASTAGVPSESINLESDQRDRTLIISDQSRTMPDTEMLRDRSASVRDMNLRSSAKQKGRVVDWPLVPVDRLPFGVTRNIVITRAGGDEAADGQPDGRAVSAELDGPPSSSSDRRSGHEGVDGRTGSVANVGTPPCETMASKVVACSKKDTCVSGVVQGAQGEVNGNPSVSISGSHSESIQGFCKQVLQSDVRVQSLVEVLNDLRAVDKTEPVAYTSLIEEKYSIDISGLELSGNHSGTLPNRGWERIVSTSAAFGHPWASRESVSLPDLNENEGSAPLVLKPQLDRWQEAQLRAQILVYGALIHGNQINEPWMETAFGDDLPALNEGQNETHGGRSQWEGSWRTACERIQASSEEIASSMPAAEQRTSGGIMSSGLSQINDLDLANDVPAHASQLLTHVVDIPMSTGASQLVGTEPTAAGQSSGTSNPVASAHPPGVGGNPDVVSPVVDSLDNEDVATRRFMVTTEAITTVTTGPAGGVVGIIAPEIAPDPAGMEQAALTCAENFQDVTSIQQAGTSDADIQAGNAMSRLGSPTLGNKFSLAAMHRSHAMQASLTKEWTPLTGVNGAGTSLIPNVVTAADTSTPLLLQTIESVPQDHTDTTGGDVSSRRDNTVENPSNAVGRIEASGEAVEGVAAAAGSVPSTLVENVQPASSSRQQLPPGLSARFAAPSVAPGSGHMNGASDRGGFGDMAASQLDQARISAEAAVAAAASAADQRQAVWSRVEAGSPANLASEQEHQAASAAASLAAAASVAKAAAEIAKMAFEAASLVKDEFEAASQVKSTADETREASAPSGLGVLHEAREQTLKRAEDAAAAKRRADTLDAIARAAELATEAAAHTGAVISMGDPFPLTLDALRRDGVLNYWKPDKPPETSGGKQAEATAVLRKSTERKAVVQRKKAMDVIDAETKRTSKTVSPGKKQISPPLKGRLRVAKKVQINLKPQAKVKVLPKSRRPAGSTRSPVAKKPVVRRASLSRDLPSATKADVVGAPVVQSDAGMNGSINKGTVVEVLGDEDGLRGAWFTGKVVALRPGEVLVTYDEILHDDGSGPLQEWVQLGPTGNGGQGAPRVRVAHPITASKIEKAKKRRRSAGGNRKWAIGDRVDAWIRDGWWEGVVTAVNNEDVTVHFPGEGDTTEVKSWDLRPTLAWRDGTWKESQPDDDEAGTPAKQQKVSAQVLKVQPSKETGKNEAARKSRAGGKGETVTKPGKQMPELLSEVRAAEEKKDGPSSKKRKQAELTKDDVVGKTTAKRRTPARDEQEDAQTDPVTPASQKRKPKRTLKTKARTSNAKTPVTGISGTMRKGVGQTSDTGVGGVGGSAQTSDTGVQAKVARSAKASGRGKKAVNAKRSTKATPAKEKERETPAVAETPSASPRTDSSPAILESARTPGREGPPENSTKGGTRGVPNQADADEGDDAGPSANPKGKSKEAQKGSKVKTSPQKEIRRKSSRKSQATRKVLEGLGKLSKKDTVQGGRGEERFGSSRRVQTLGHAVQTLLASRC